MHNTVILLGHKARSGKDTLADYMASYYGFKRFSFAAKVKSIVSDLYHMPITDDNKETQDKRYPNLIDQSHIPNPDQWPGADEINFALDHGVKYEDMLIKNPNFKSHLTPRRLLQIFAQQQRKICPTIWADYVFNTINSIVDECFLTDQYNVVISDFRYLNEYEVAKKWVSSGLNRKIYCIRIDRENINKIDDESENDLNSFNHWDYIFTNNGSKEDLFNQFSKLYNTL